MSTGVASCTLCATRATGCQFYGSQPLGGDTMKHGRDGNDNALQNAQKNEGVLIARIVNHFFDGSDGDCRANPIRDGHNSGATRVAGPTTKANDFARLPCVRRYSARSAAVLFVK
jgi:hypothetical protein